MIKMIKLFLRLKAEKNFRLTITKILRKDFILVTSRVRIMVKSIEIID